MNAQDDGFGLSLSLRLPDYNQNPNPPPPSPPPAAAGAPFPLNLFRSPLPVMQQRKSSSSAHDAIQSSNDPNAVSRLLFRAIDMNQAITMADCDEKEMVASPNSTVSSLNGKRSCDGEENDVVGQRAASSSLEVDDDDEEGGGGDDEAAKKKLRLCKEQAAVLEETFREHNTLNLKQKLALANQLNLRLRQVEVWFQNRRARTKLKQTEVDCEYLRRCCENLTQENGRLQKEVNELRALKLSPEFYMNTSPPTTLTMCPQCERVAVSSSSSSSTAVASTEATIRGQPAHRPTMLMSSWPAVVPSQPVDTNRPRS